MQSFYIDSENTTVVNMLQAIEDNIIPEVEEDIHKFALSTSTLKKKFIFFRTCNYILERVNSCRLNGQKLLLYIEAEKPKNNCPYLSSIKTICKNLSICILFSPEPFKDFHKNILKKTGESKDRKTKINCLCSKQLKNPDISNFTKLLLRNGIHKIDGKLNTIEVKLGLYTT